MRLIFTLVLLVIGAPRISAQEISPVLFGQNHWMAQGDENRPGYLHLLWPKVQESGIELIRIGGNSYERNMPSRERLSAMVASIQSIGAEPLVQVPSQYSAEQAYDLVRFFSASNKRPIKYWSIGNEPLFFKSSIGQVHAYLKRIALAMKSADPTIKILVFDECEFRDAAYEELCTGRLDLTGQDENGRWIIDGFTFHRYPNGEQFDRRNVVFSGVEDINSSCQRLVKLLERADRMHGRTGDARLLWGLTEVNVTYANPDRDVAGIGNPSFLGGQFIAEVFGIGMKLGALTVAPWCINETDKVSTDFGYIGTPPEFHPRSSYYHVQMLSRNFRGRYLATTSNREYVKSIGSVDPERICVMILNEDETRSFDFDLVLTADARSDKALVVAADLGLQERTSGTIPSQTTMLLVLDSKGRRIRQYTYGLRQNERNLPPVVETF